MPSLPEIQAQMAGAIRHGPGHLPLGMFRGDPRRIRLAFAAHANTISHARLVALEQTFPQAMQTLGEAEFNRLSRIYVDDGGGTGGPLANIGAGFPAFLEEHALRASVDHARYDWARLQAYHAAEAEPLQIDRLAGLDEESLLDLCVARHPATRLVAGDAVLNGRLGLPEASHILIVRPEAQLAAFVADASMARLLALLSRPLSLRNLFEMLGELVDEVAILPAITGLIRAGALIEDTP